MVVSLPGIEESVIGSSLIPWTIWQLFPYGNTAKFTKMRPQRTPRGLSEQSRSEFRGCWVRPRHLYRHNLEIRKTFLKDVGKSANFLLLLFKYIFYTLKYLIKSEPGIFRSHASKSPCHDSHDSPKPLHRALGGA